MLTLTDFFDLIGEHTPCWCPISNPAARHADDCPTHVVLRKHREAALRDEASAIPQSLFPLDHLAAYLSGWDEETPRVTIAVVLWRVTAQFANDAAALKITPGASISETAEQYVRDHWAEAETNQSARPGLLISRFLDDVGLLEDYTRVKQQRQHLAFASMTLALAPTRRSFTIRGVGGRTKRDPGTRTELHLSLEALDQDGKPSGPALGEWRLVWSGPHDEEADLALTVAATSWKTLVQTRFHEILAELATTDSEQPAPTAQQVAQRLLSAGWVDATAKPLSSRRLELGLVVADRRPKP